MAIETGPASRSLFDNWRRVLWTCGLPKDRAVDPVSRWLMITRACVQPMTLTSGAIAGLLAASSPRFDGLLFALAAVGIVIAHAANNMINDFFDLRSGLDTDVSPRGLYAPHPVLGGLVTKEGLLKAIIVANALDASIMLFLLSRRGWPIVAFAVTGLFISVFYVAPPLRLKARGLGEPSVFVIWAPLMVGGTYYAAVGSIPADIYWASVPYGLLVMTVLMGKHIDKAPWDAPAGIKTLPVLLGDVAARRVTLGLMLAFYVSIAALVAASVVTAWTLSVGVALPLLVRTWRTYARPKPDRPPARFPVWPLWFGPWAFVHARRAGALFVLGLVVGLIL
ncbi:MAG: prenyltransferase [Actinomycetota bacterium]